MPELFGIKNCRTLQLLSILQFTSELAPSSWDILRLLTLPSALPSPSLALIPFGPPNADRPGDPMLPCRLVCAQGNQVPASEAVSVLLEKKAQLSQITRQMTKCLLSENCKNNIDAQKIYICIYHGRNIDNGSQRKLSLKTFG